MNPVTHSITGSRSLTPAAIKHWQATPMRLTVSLESGQNITGASSIIAEIHSERGSTPSELLASEELTVSDNDGPWTIDFTGPQMNQSVSTPYRMFWLVIVAQYPTDDRIEVLACATLRLDRHNASLITATPPDPSTSYLTAAQIAALYATITDFDALEARVADLEANGTGGGASSLVIRIVDATDDATDTALHLAYNPLTLTIPAESPAGFSGALQSHTPGTVKLVLPTGFEVYYDDLPAGTTGRPVIAFRGGRIDYAIIAPNRIIIRGDYLSTAAAWHPTDAGDNLLGFWQAGPDIMHGGHVSFPCADTESIDFTADLLMRWEATFGSRANARFVYDWLANTDGAGDQGTSPGSFAPSLIADTAFASGYAYILRESSANSHFMRARDSAGDLAPTAPCRIFLALRQTSTGMGATTLLSVNSSAAYVSGTPGGLQWRGGPYGYQFLHINSGGSFGSKGGTFATHEDTVSAILLTLVISASGQGTIYSGSTQVSAPLTVSTAAALDFLQFRAGQNMRLSGVAVINGTSSDLTAEITAMQALLLP